MAGTESLEKGLRRGDAEVTVRALLRLPEHERAPFLDPAGVLFRAAVRTAHQGKDWSKLTYWGSRAEKLPGLVGSIGTPEFLSAHWALMWGAIKTKERERAARWFGPLEPVLQARSPAFAQALGAVVTGTATPEQVTPFLVNEPALDPRLGHEPKRARQEWAAPASPEAAEQTVLAMVGREPWNVFAANVAQWAPKVDDATRVKLWELAGSLAVREALKRATSEHAQLEEPAALLGLAVGALGPTSALTDEVMLMLRLVASRTPHEVRALRAARTLAAAVRTASAFPKLRPLAIAVVTGRTFLPEASPPIMRVLDHLAAQQPDVELVGKSLLLLANLDPRSRKDELRASPDLVRALSAVIQTNGSGLGAWLEGVAEPIRDNLFAFMSYMLPIELLQAFVPAVWAAAPQTRDELLSIVDHVLLRLGDEDSNLDDFSFDQDALAKPLKAQGRPFWNAVRDLVLPEDLSFLPFALREARADERGGILARLIGQTPKIEWLLAIWEALWTGDSTAPLGEVEALLFKRYGEDQHALIHGVLEADQLELPLALRRKLAVALQAQAHLPCDCAQRTEALALAKQWLKKAGGKAKKKPNAPGRPRKSKVDDDPIPF